MLQKAPRLNAATQVDEKTKPHAISIKDLGLTPEEMELFANGSQFLFGVESKTSEKDGLEGA